MEVPLSVICNGRTKWVAKEGKGGRVGTLFSPWGILHLQFEGTKGHRKEVDRSRYYLGPKHK
jgi:hypothetical protein